MADAGFFKGTSADQDRRFSDKEVKLLKTMKFPPEFDKKVDMRKVNLTVIRPWVAKKIVELIGFEDEVVVEYAMGLLEDESQPMPDPRKMQINLTGFLTKDTPVFMNSLWKLLLEAQDDVTGVPRTFVEQKKEEMRRARENDTRAIDERDRRARLDEIRDGERGGRGGMRGRGRGRGRGGRGGFDDSRGGDRPRDAGWGVRGFSTSKFTFTTTSSSFSLHYSQRRTFSAPIQITTPSPVSFLRGQLSITLALETTFSSAWQEKSVSRPQTNPASSISFSFYISVSSAKQEKTKIAFYEPSSRARPPW
ncbi:hypothetical protein NLJ89_g3195 [Agrocybe chaxingu]|uniref:PWI domain-containing protein n=1 Tax=Agrocybe chaxingu TaxID=84603 RepID=A0A9W8K5C7_9AGAR|nr:hypothetical protein NLJ89_g3195 [Agrocybe chaxingu]